MKAKAPLEGRFGHFMGRGAVIAFSVLVTLGLAAMPAAAGIKSTHVLQDSFDGTGSTGGTFEPVVKIAVDEVSGDVYVLYTHRNEDEPVGYLGKFDSAGNPKAFTSNQLPPGTTSLDGSDIPAGKLPTSAVSALVVDNSATSSQGNIYLVESNPGHVYVFAPSGDFIKDLDLGNAEALAIDSAGFIWTSGDTFVGGSRTAALHKYSPQGQHLLTVIQQHTSGDSLAIDSANNLYTGASHAGESVYKFSSPSFAESLFAQSSGQMALDRSSGEVYVRPVISTGEIGPISVFSSSGEEIDSFNETSGLALAVNGKTGTVYADSFVFSNAFVDVFVPATVTIPDVSIDPPSSITTSGATLSGVVNPASHPAEYRFEYKRAIDSTWTKTPSQGVGSGSDDVDVSTGISGLEFGTKYEARLVATNTENGKSAIAKTSFKTAPEAPEVETLAAAPRTATTARVNANINANGGPTTYYFEYGLDTSYGSVAPAAKDGDGGDELGFKLQSAELTGLTPGTTYHYRVMASNPAGSDEGQDATFITRSLAETAVTRGIELVNQPDKGNQAVFPILAFASPGLTSAISPTSEDGDEIVWRVLAGTPQGHTGSAEPYRSVRTGPGSWTSTSLAPPASEQLYGGDRAYNALGASVDFSRSLFAVYSGVLASLDTPIVRRDQDGKQQTLFTIPGKFNFDVARDRMEGTDDLSHLVVQPIWEPGGHLYDYGRGEPELLDVMPDGEPSCGISISPPGSFASSDGSATYHFISMDDASLVYFGTQDENCEGSAQIYLRDRDAGTTELISGPALEGELQPARFIRATHDATTAIFVTATKLAEEDGNEGADLYRYVRNSGVTCLTCNVEGGNAEVNPDAVIASPDLSYIYFDSEQQLVSGRGAPGQANLYVWHQGSVDFVADDGIAGARSPIATTTLSRDGRSLLFTSARDLTADRVGSCGALHCTELYRYDAADGSLECISCVHTGTTSESVSNFFSSADGSTAIFTTAAPLVQRDVNQAKDVYEWRNGVIRLVTDGVTEFPEGGVGAPTAIAIDANGSNLFFTVAASLTGHESDQVTNLYDARIGGGTPPPIPPAHCAEDSCQGPLSPEPKLQSSGSAAFNGRGNAVTRQKKKARQHKKKKRQQQAKRNAKKHQAKRNG